jgi:hypothetical protein
MGLSLSRLKWGFNLLWIVKYLLPVLIDHSSYTTSVYIQDYGSTKEAS